MSVPDPQTQVRRLYALTEQLRAENADLRRGHRMPSSAPSSPVSGIEPPPGTCGHPDPAQAAQERRARYARAITPVYSSRSTRNLNLIANAVMKVADAEAMERRDECARMNRALGGEVERLLAELADRDATIDRLSGERESDPDYLAGSGHWLGLGLVGIIPVHDPPGVDSLAATKSRITEAAHRMGRPT